MPFHTVGLGHLEAFALARLCLLRHEGVCAGVGEQPLGHGCAAVPGLVCSVRSIFPFDNSCSVIKSQKGLAWEGLKDHPVSHGQGHLS